jgi:hypothetical protein
MRRAAKILLWSVFGVLAQASPGQAPLPVDMRELRQVLDNAIAEVGAAERLLVDPRIVEQMAQSLGIYTTNFCSPKHDCRKTLIESPTMRRAVAAHVRALRALPSAPIQVFGDRLAEGNFPRAGWPSEQTVEVGLLELPATLHRAPLHMRFATGLAKLGTGKALLALPGPITLEANVDGKDSRWTAVVLDRKVATLNLGADVSTVARPLQPLPTAFCRPVEFTASGLPASSPLAHFNQGRATLREDPKVRAANEAPYLTQHGVDIRVAIEPGITCDRDCEYSLSSLFADAVATWRVGCGRCSPNALVVMRSNSILWIDWRIARRLRLAAQGAGAPRTSSASPCSMRCPNCAARSSRTCSTE